MDDMGLPATEAIPGLMAAVVFMASYTPDPAQALDEAVALLDSEPSE